jgi:RNA polymerase sigma factor (sigma-70 family)
MAIAIEQLERLYRRHASRMLGIVGATVVAPEAAIEDACQIAWARLVDHRHSVSVEGALAWVAKTAMREAVRMSRDDTHVSIEIALEEDAAGEVIALRVPGEDERLEQRQRLCALTALPRRQQRLLWLKGFGLSYQEMAVHEGCTRRTVERQLLRAMHAVAT